MEAWRTLRDAIPDRQVKPVALRMHVSHDYVLRWRREPLSDESPSATGMASPLSRNCLLIDAVFPENPTGASLIVEHVNMHYRLLTEAHDIRGFTGFAERALASADILTQATQAVISLNEGVTEDTLQKLVLLRDAADAVIPRVGKQLYHRSHSPGAMQ
jgi:hypothetical protein